MAKARRNLLQGLEFPFPLKGYDVGWARAKQPGLTTPDALNVLPFDADRRFRGAKRPGFSILTGGAIGSVELTFRRAQKCADDTFTTLWVNTTEIGSYPYTFSYAGVCYYVAETATSTTPTGTITVSGARVSYADCTACAAGVGPPPPPPPPAATYRQVRRCDTDALAPFYIPTTADPDKRFLRTSDDNCYYFNISDPTTTTPGTLLGTSTEYDDCELCEAATGGGGEDEYYQAYTCDGVTPLDCWILADDITTPFVFFRFDHLDAPVLISGGHETSTSPGTIYAVPDDVIEVGSCEQTGGCYEETFPDNTIVTFSGVTMQATCRVCDVTSTESWKTTGTVNGSYNLVKQSESPTRVVYILAIGVHVLGYGRECGSNTNCSSSTPPGECDPQLKDGDLFQIRLEVDVMFGTPTGFRVMIGPSPLGTFSDIFGPLGFKGEASVLNCRETKVISNEIVSRYMAQANSVLTGDPLIDFFASGGNVTVTLGF